MEKSDHYYLRKYHMQNLIVPTISDVKRELGEDLSEAFFSQCPDPLKPYMGLVPPLTGAGNDLWISPSDTLIGKVVLKPPLTTKHMKALTHQGILMIGRGIEIKFWNEAELNKQKALQELEEILLFIAEMQKRQAVQDAHKEEGEICVAEKSQMREEFAILLQNELEKLQNKLEAEYKELMRIQKLHLEDEWQEKLEAAVAETVDKLTKKCKEDMTKQEAELLSKFSKEIKKEQIKRKLELQAAQEHCRDIFKQLRHELQCKNIVNMMYIICVERRKCLDERTYMESNYQKQIQELQANISDKEVELSQLTNQRNEKIKEIELREECLLEILRQFQKFINFALRAAPTQAEFLLSVEKMMIFELTQAVAKTHPKHKRLAETLIPWKDESETETTSSKKSLTPEDHHSCYNETEPPIITDDVSITSNDYLPAFHYDKHMYVREEFRNMMSQGLKISPSNLIWNRDVEHLMQILRKSDTSINKEEKDNESSESSKSDQKSSKAESDEEDPFDVVQQSRKSIVHFHKSKEDNLLFPTFDSDSSQLISIDLHPEELKETKQSSTSDIQPIERECCTRCTQTILKPLVEEKVVAKTRRLTAVPLIGTVNSLELHKEPSKGTSISPTLQFVTADEEESNRSAQNVEFDTKTKDEGLAILTAKDSLIKHRMSLRNPSKLFKNFNNIIAPKVFELGKKTSEESSVPTNSSSSKGSKKQSSTDGKDISRLSKLSLARDSVLVHKQSLSIKRKSFENESTDHSSPNAARAQKSLRGTSVNECTSKKLPKSSISGRKISPPGSAKISYGLLSPTQSQAASQKLKIAPSKLSLSRDSLQLLRSQSMLSGGLRIKHREESKQSVEIKTSILGSHLQRSSPPISIKIDDDGSRVVKMSHIEIHPLKEGKSDTDIYKYDTSKFTASGSPCLVYDKITSVQQKPRDNYLTKPNVAEIVGERKEEEHSQENKEFTIHRVSSMMSIFRKHPSLIKMFTSCTM